MIFPIFPILHRTTTTYLDQDALVRGREFGRFFETLVFLHVRAQCEMMKPRAMVNYWRTTTGKEVDFVLEHGRKLLAFEVKLTDNPTVRDIQNLLLFMEDYPETVRGILVHGGKDVKWLHSKVLAAPWWWIDV